MTVQWLLGIYYVLCSKEEKEIVSVLNVVTIQCDTCEERCVSGTTEAQGKEQWTCLWGNGRKCVPKMTLMEPLEQ